MLQVIPIVLFYTDSNFSKNKEDIQLLLRVF